MKTFLSGVTESTFVKCLNVTVNQHTTCSSTDTHKLSPSHTCGTCICQSLLIIHHDYCACVSVCVWKPTGWITAGKRSLLTVHMLCGCPPSSLQGREALCVCVCVCVCVSEHSACVFAHVYIKHCLMNMATNLSITFCYLAGITTVGPK